MVRLILGGRIGMDRCLDGWESYEARDREIQLSAQLHHENWQEMRDWTLFRRRRRPTDREFK